MLLRSTKYEQDFGEGRMNLLSEAMREILSPLFKGNLFPAGCAEHSLFRQLCQKLLCTWIFWRTTKNLLCGCWNLGKRMAGNVLEGQNLFWDIPKHFPPYYHHCLLLA